MLQRLPLLRAISDRILVVPPSMHVLFCLVFLLRLGLALLRGHLSVILGFHLGGLLLPRFGDFGIGGLLLLRGLAATFGSSSRLLLDQRRVVVIVFGFHLHLSLSPGGSFLGRRERFVILIHARSPDSVRIGILDLGLLLRRFLGGTLLGHEWFIIVIVRVDGFGRLLGGLRPAVGLRFGVDRSSGSPLLGGGYQGNILVARGVILDGLFPFARGSDDGLGLDTSVPQQTV
jgi:hypothetical protein